MALGKPGYSTALVDRFARSQFLVTQGREELVAKKGRSHSGVKTSKFVSYDSTDLFLLKPRHEHRRQAACPLDDVVVGILSQGVA